MQNNIGILNGIGEKRKEIYKKLGIYTIKDLFDHLPRRYIDLSTVYNISNAPAGQLVAIRAKLTYISDRLQTYKVGAKPIKLLAEVSGSVLEMFVFGYVNVKINCEYIFYGVVDTGFIKRRMKSPTIFPVEMCGRLLPVYPASKGLTSQRIAADVERAFGYIDNFKESISRKILEKYSLVDIQSAYKFVHYPKNIEEVEKGRKRLVFEELLVFACAMAQLKKSSSNFENSCIVMKKFSLQRFKELLPYTPTDEQKNAVNSAIVDMCSGSVMNRLLEGDVGSGKTMVAMALCYFVYLNGYASAVMAPTEVLAEQHYKSFSEVFQKLGVKVELLTGSTKLSEKRRIKQALAAGEISVCIGTHALLTEDVVFEKLAFVVTDEQHRFGVAQRMTLSSKGHSVHTLVMSATPIPRTLGLIMYGDMQLSTIRQLPKGRKSVSTYVIDYKKIYRAYNFIKKQLEQGFQAYIVCPLVEDGENLEKISATELYDELRTGIFANFSIGLLHGKLKAPQKEAIMRDFAENKINLLVSTTVIEVGIDVPNSTVILVHNAECFGLSQLHQLRGRVGRGSIASSCILVSSVATKNTRDRLNMLKNSNDGFAIAEYDLKLRGPGDFFGTRQHGLLSIKLSDFLRNTEDLETVAKAAHDICIEDSLENYPVLYKKVENLIKERIVL